MAKSKKSKSKRPGAKRPANTAALRRGQNMMKAASRMYHAGEARSMKDALKFLASEAKYAGNPRKPKAKSGGGKKRSAPKGAKARMQRAAALYHAGKARSMAEALQMLAGPRSLLF